MFLYDSLVIFIFSLAASLIKSRDAAWCALAYASTVVFAWSPMFDFFAPSYSYIHISYAIIISLFIPLVNSNFFAALGLGMYVGFNLIVATDYLFYPEIDTIISNNYLYLHIILVFCLIYLSTKEDDNNDGDWVPIINHFTNSVEDLQCTAQHIQTLENGERWK